MKILVDKITDEKDCIYSYFKPYPPFVEIIGHYICKIDEKDCRLNLCTKECRYLKEVNNEQFKRNN